MTPWIVMRRGAVRWVDLDPVRVVSLHRVRAALGVLPPALVDQLDQALRLQLSL